MEKIKARNEAVKKINACYTVQEVWAVWEELTPNVKGHMLEFAKAERIRDIVNGFWK